MLETNMLHESDTLIQRSKSYDARLNYVYDNTSVYYDENDPDSQSNQKNNNNINTNTNNTQTHTSNPSKPAQSDKDSSQTQIIVTSFAPDPKTKNLVRTTTQTRPVSQLTVTRIIDNSAQMLKTQQEIASQDYKRKINVIWPDGKNNPPLIIFSAKVLRKTCWDCKKIGEQFRMTYKFQHGEKKLVKAILDGHGFKEAHPNSSEFNIIWTGNNLKSYAFRSLQENQKVNHFPRSCELTRKDRLYKNVQRMQKEKGSKVFNMLPVTFVMPFEIDEFYNTFYREKGIWIVKPVSLSRGRGIYLISHPDQIPLEDNLVVSKYISNPMLIEGFKFDLRLYVAVTSFDPLVFYLYEEGLTRFATVKYDQNLRNIRNTCMHLTNYSLNKKNEKYVRCNDPDVEDYGNKWTMSALLRYLKSHGKDTFGLMMHIEEAIIKTLLAVESPLASAARMFVPNRNNCFELFGFDILVDEEMKPWVLEVNLSPSLDCDALLDIRVKSNMLSDLFTLSGIYCTNPNNFSSRSRLKDRLNNPKSDLRVRPHSAGLVTNNNSKTNQTNNSNSNTSNISSNNHNNTNNNTNTQFNSNTNTNTNTNTNHNQNGNTIYVTASNNNQLNNISETNFKSGDPLYDGLNHTEQEILRTVVNEQARTETWIRLFPTADTWEFYSQFLENRSTSYNMMVHKKLYPRKWQQNTIKKATHSRAKILQNLHATYGESINLYNSTESSGASLIEAIERYKKYERKITDDLKPSEETLKRLSNAPLFQLGLNQSNQNLKSSNFTVFPNGDSKASAKNFNSSSNEEESFDNLNSSKLALAYPTQSSYQVQNFHQTNNNSKKPLTLSAMVKKAKQKEDQYDEEFSDDENTAEDDEEFNPRAKNSLENKYDLATVLRYLQSGYYISRIQVRNAFALYLFKIHVRLVTESQNKDDTNIQQMDLVLRFIKKAAPNLSQEFKVYVPSRRLPLSEQKRMLAKQLHDFLHIYRKDTGQIRIDMTGQLEQERKRYRNKRIDEKAFQSLLYKCTEAELEEIMSVYMKNSQDSTVFLGTSKNPSNSLNNETQQSPQEIISFNLTASNSDTGTGTGGASKPEPSFEPSTSVSLKPKSNMITSSLPISISSLATDRSTLKSAIGYKAKTPQPKKPATNSSNDTSNLTNPKQAKRPDTGTITKLQPYTIKTVNDTSNTNSDINPTTATTSSSTANSKLNDSSAFNKKKPPPPPLITIAAATASNNNTKKPANSGDEISGMSCDSHSGFSNSSESEKDYRSRSRSHSRSLSRSTSISVHLKNSPQQKLKKKRITESKSAVSNFHLRKTSSPKANRFSNTNENSANVSLKTPRMSERSKTFSHNPSSSRKSDYEAVITNIYLNTTHKFPVNSLNHLFNNNYAKQKKNYNQNVRPLSTSVSKYSANYNSQHATTDKPIENISAKKFNPALQQLASVSLNSPNTTKEPVNSSNNNNNRNNNVYVHKHTTHNQASESKNNTNSNWQEESSNSNNSNNYHPILLNGLKNLSLRKQERVYSATKSAFRLASTLNLNELETNQEIENSNEDLNTKFSRDSKLIDHLERQKEQTNRLLLKSKAKHNELISAIQKPELA